MVTLYRPEAVPVVEDEGKNRSPLVSIGLIAVGALIAVLAYLTAKQVTRTTEIAESSAQNAREISVIGAQVKQQADALRRSAQANNQIVQELHNTDLQRDERMNRLEQASNSLKETIDQLAIRQARLANGLESLAARMPATPQSVPKPAPQPQAQPRPTNPPPSAMPAVVPSKHNHEGAWMDDASAPPGTVVLKNETRGVIWLLQKDGKLQSFRPFEQTTVGIFLHSLSDGKDYIISPGGDWVGEAN